MSDLNVPSCSAQDVIYYLYNPATKYIKIGYTSDIRARISALKSSLGVTPILLGVTVGYEIDETEAHEQFAASRVQGEWFVCTYALMDHIAIYSDGLLALRSLHWWETRRCDANSFFIYLAAEWHDWNRARIAQEMFRVTRFPPRRYFPCPVCGYEMAHYKWTFDGKPYIECLSCSLWTEIRRNSQEQAGHTRGSTTLDYAQTVDAKERRKRLNVRW